MRTFLASMSGLTMCATLALAAMVAPVLLGIA